MQFAWSKNRYDRDGDLAEDAIFIHLGDNIILRFDFTKELRSLADSLHYAANEIDKYGDEY